ncbi:MAG: P-loop NTPase [Acidobacteria bacterium]|nr:P-loop NTPase [Acidobacteriota bacterium]
MLNQEQALDALRLVVEPGLQRDIVALGFVQELKVSDGRVAFELQTVRPGEAAEKLKREAEDKLKAAGAEAVAIELTGRARGNPVGDGQGSLPGVRNIIPIASGKGGVGKSTVSANLAVALRQTGARVGLLDADIYGPSIPTIMGARQGPQLQGQQIIPPVLHGVAMCSTGFFLNPDQAVMWRGPMLSKMVDELFRRVIWGELDYLIVDLPPGTGDVQITMCQRIALTGAVIVTTPQPVAVQVAEKAVIMFQQLKTPLLGVVENMAYFESAKTGEREYIFGSGGADALAGHWDIPVLGRIPLATNLRESSDAGAPIVVSNPDSPAAKGFADAAAQLIAAVSVRNLNAEKPVEINF